MMKKLITFLLALATSVGMMNAKVTWNSSNVSDLRVSGTRESYSKEGVTLSANADMIDAMWQGYGDESRSGISFNANETGGYTFSNTLGKNFTKIEMSPNASGGWDYANLGSGWSISGMYGNGPVTVTWTGNAATVDLLKDASNFNGEPVKSIVFYFVGDSEAPDPTYTVALKAGTANADKVKLSATSAVEGATITVTPNEEYEIKAFKATYNTTEELSTSFNAETGAYSFTMPAANVTIEATIALNPVYTVALQDGTVNADKVTLSATSAVEGKTITVTPNEDYEITAFSAYYVVVEDQLGSIYEIDATLNAETGAYSFTMPAYDVTIEATIALKPVPEGDVFAGFTATAGSGGFDNEGHANLVDNKFTDGNWTKWCTNNDHKSVPTGESESCWWIDFEASAALSLTGYILTTGNDSGSEHGRNPKNWVIKAKLNADDAWTTIATVTNDVTMKNQSFKDYKFFVDQSGSYKYFRFEVFANQGANVMQLCELRLIGTEASEPVLVTAHTLQLHVNDAAMGSVAVTNLLGSDIIDNGDGTFTVPEGAEVTLLATPNEGYEFSGWKASSTICDFAECEFVALPTVDNPLTFDMYAEAAFMAEFAAVAPQPQIGPKEVLDLGTTGCVGEHYQLTGGGTNIYRTVGGVDNKTITIESLHGEIIDNISLKLYYYNVWTGYSVAASSGDVSSWNYDAYEDLVITNINATSVTLSRVGSGQENGYVMFEKVTINNSDEPEPELAECGLEWTGVPEGGVVGTIGHEDEVQLPQLYATNPDFINALMGGTATVRLGSTDESVLKVLGFNNFQAIAAGECDVYAVHDEDAVFAYDSVAFHVTIKPAEEPASEYAEIIFTEVVGKDDLAADASFALVGTTFSATITDPDNKMSIDANSCRFGDEEDCKSYSFRLKSGGKSSSEKNFITLNIPEAGKLRIAARSSNSSATDRALVIEQGGTELYNAVVMDAQAIEVTEGEATVKVFPYVEVAVAAGSVRVSYTDGMNFYSFGFLASTATGVDEIANGKSQTIKVIRDGQLLIIRDGKIYNVMGTVVR